MPCPSSTLLYQGIQMGENQGQIIAIEKKKWIWNNSFWKNPRRINLEENIHPYSRIWLRIHVIKFKEGHATSCLCPLTERNPRWRGESAGITAKQKQLSSSALPHRAQIKWTMAKAQKNPSFSLLALTYYYSLFASQLADGVTHGKYGHLAYRNATTNSSRRLCSRPFHLPCLRSSLESMR